MDNDYQMSDDSSIGSYMMWVPPQQQQQHEQEGQVDNMNANIDPTLLQNVQHMGSWPNSEDSQNKDEIPSPEQVAQDIDRGQSNEVVSSRTLSIF